MSPDLHEWISLLIGWTHVFAGILWVGTTFYFTWLDGRFAALEKSADPGGKDPNSKRVWMVHSGGFYVVEKQKAPALMPQKLHWFRWEAAITWLSGLLLFALVYYHGGLMLDLDEARISRSTAIWLSLGLLVASVVFIMISNHSPPITFGQRHGWRILSALVLAGWGAAKILRRT